MASDLRKTKFQDVEGNGTKPQTQEEEQQADNMTLVSRMMKGLGQVAIKRYDYPLLLRPNG
jgi:hypothetical protein